jgi:hypothetical protein
VQDWNLRNISDYWDQRVGAIERLSRVIETIPESRREAEVNALYDAVSLKADALPDEELIKFAVPMVDDLYKAINQRAQFDECDMLYVQFSASAFFNALKRRGYMVHYFTNNTFSDLVRPVYAFPAWFGAARLLYICPQEIATRNFEGNKPAEEWPSLIQKYLTEARLIANGLADRCLAEGRHFLFLDIDAQDFPAAEKSLDQPGVIWVFRAEAPTQGSPIKPRFPPGPRVAKVSGKT